ncbi:hypothetical protein [Ostreibacterium oceani]|uniref:Uncharacterized protein n=1 Tax=Ostreibacterium oceani TaxID=2654998 RepID=A0A6N7EXV6_9GAMM|nr:hypothetical protein [Ostreibacterium oceani]MPV85957.1 hypothetical protein [Ostreibacterium oceani]
MGKVIFLVILAGIGYVLYDGLKPYYDALQESDRILIDAGIPLDKKGAGDYRPKAIEALKANCTHGLFENNQYDFRCASNSHFPFIN